MVGRNCVLLLLCITFYYNLSFGNGQFRYSATDLIKVIKPLNISNFVVVMDADQISMSMTLFKRLMDQGHSVKGMTSTGAPRSKDSLVASPVLWISEDIQTLMETLNRIPKDTLDFRAASRQPFLVLSITSDLHLRFNLTIDQQVYFLDLNSKTLIETYAINGFRIQQNLGQYDEALMWSKNPNVSGNPFDIISQRSDFMGIKLKAMTETQAPFILFLDGFKSKSSSVIKETYEVTKQCQSWSILS